MEKQINNLNEHNKIAEVELKLANKKLQMVQKETESEMDPNIELQNKKLEDLLKS